MEMEMMNDETDEFRMSPSQQYQYLSKVAPYCISLIKLDLTVPNNNSNSTTKNGKEDDDGMVTTTITTTTSSSRCWEDEIPTEILVKILSGMSIRRLVQYLGISKTWFHTITHHVDSANQEPGFIVIHSRPGYSTRLSFNVTQGGVKPKSSTDYAPFDILLSNHSSFESSCNGLICLKQYSSSFEYISSSSSAAAKYRILVCNPYRLEATTLPNIINNNSSSSSSFPQKQQHHHHHDEQNFNFKENYGLGFSPSTNQYKVVRVTWFDEDRVIHHVSSFRKNKQDGSITRITRLRQPEKIQILTLGGGGGGGISSTNCWRDVSSVPSFPIYGSPVYANGSLHWKVDTRNKTIEDFCIISFDIGKEEFHVIRQPPYVRLIYDSRCLDLINWRGSLGMVKYGVVYLDIWILQLNNNKQQQWIREYTIENGYSRMTKVIGLWEHGEILGYIHYSSTLISYDPKTSKRRLIHVRSGFDPMDAYRHEVQGHTGSLVSLKAYGCKTWRTAPGRICPNLYDRDSALFSKEEEGVDPTTVQLLTEYISDPVLGRVTYDI